MEKMEESSELGSGGGEEASLHLDTTEFQMPNASRGSCQGGVVAGGEW